MPYCRQVYDDDYRSARKTTDRNLDMSTKTIPLRQRLFPANEKHNTRAHSLTSITGARAQASATTPPCAPPPAPQDARFRARRTRSDDVLGVPVVLVVSGHLRRFLPSAINAPCRRRLY